LGCGISSGILAPRREVDAARALLADPAWLSNKQQRLGIQPLLADPTPRCRIATARWI
jgi:hypothetical protein